jgi:Domain of unknown function (DUF4159)/Aerotolerance regulator N-terminal
MTAFLQDLTFTTPVALAALMLLPLIWWLLRFTPPKPQTIKFPPLRLLLELVNRQEQPDKTPWWLMLLRLAIAALVILGVSHPFFAPGQSLGASNTPLLLVVDDTWAAAKNWTDRKTALTNIINASRETGSAINIATTAPTARATDVVSANADVALDQVAALEPKALNADRAGLMRRLKADFGASKGLRVVWLSDGLDQASALEFSNGLASLANGKANVEVLLPDASALPAVFAAPTLENGDLKIHVVRTAGSSSRELGVRALATNGRTLANTTLRFTSSAMQATTTLDLPLELRNEVQRVEIVGETSAAATYLFDDRWRRKSVALQTGGNIEDAQPLLSPLYYVSRALEPFAEISEPEDSQQLKNRLSAGLSMLVLADIGVIPRETSGDIGKWVDGGGILLRFAGPRLVASQDKLLPVNLRDGGRTLNSAMSWETPQSLLPFTEDSPFSGLIVDENIKVSRQVLAEPDNDLQGKVWASLVDGTPLVTAKRQGDGLIVLFHVTANADWSNLPLSGLFVQMLQRINDLARGAGSGATASTKAIDNRAAAFSPRLAISGRGEITAPSSDAKPILAQNIGTATPTPSTPAGLYSNNASERAINLLPAAQSMTRIADLPKGVEVRSYVQQPRQALAPLLFTAAIMLFLLDTLAALFMSGGWRRLRGMAAALVLFILPMPDTARADDAFAMKAAQQMRLAYVTTGDAAVDTTSEQGMKGLSLVLADRTSVNPAEPLAINIESDEIVFFPIIYWPVLADAKVPSVAAIAKMDDYMKNGGTIFFDLRDDQNGFDGESGPTLALRGILEQLDIPALEPVPETHVLTHSFYLLKEFPGRYATGKLWVESANNSDVDTSDGVSSIIIGSNDYAAAWALDESGNPLNAVIGNTDRQRELAFRSGINIVMYALTGNYKADQVHVPALLERLGQ